MIINLTQHPATPDQVEAGVFDLAGDELAALREALTFHELPSEEDIRNRAEFVAELACCDVLTGFKNPGISLLIGGFRRMGQHKPMLVMKPSLAFHGRFPIRGVSFVLLSNRCNLEMRENDVSQSTLKPKLDSGQRLSPLNHLCSPRLERTSRPDALPSATDRLSRRR